MKVNCKEYFEKKMADAVTHMSILVGYPVQNSDKGMHEAKSDVYNRGDCDDVATADAICELWRWASFEIEYHEWKEKEMSKEEK